MSMSKEMTTVLEVFVDAIVAEEQVEKSLGSFYNVMAVVIVDYHIFQDR